LPIGSDAFVSLALFSAHTVRAEIHIPQLMQFHGHCSREVQLRSTSCFAIVAAASIAAIKSIPRALIFIEASVDERRHRAMAWCCWICVVML
jgi:hypothetical protein